MFFDSTIDRTDLDGKRWKTFWDGASGRPVRSAHMNIEGKDSDFAEPARRHRNRRDCLGCHCSDAGRDRSWPKDGWRGVAESLRLGHANRFLRGSVAAILDASYEIYLTADHGNLEALGDGSVPQAFLRTLRPAGTDLSECDNLCPHRQPACRQGKERGHKTAPAHLPAIASLREGRLCHQWANHRFPWRSQP